jgi:hypothetical protein
MLKILCLITSVVFAAPAVAQSTQPGQTTPSVMPSDTPAVTPSQTPGIPQSTPPVAPSDTPGATRSAPPSTVGGPSPGVLGGPVGGLSRCENLIGIDKANCLEQERAAATGGTAGRPAGAVR